MFTKILACTDGSLNSIRAIHAAAEIAVRFHSDVVAVNVLHAPAPVVPYVAAMETAPDLTLLIEQAQREQTSELACTETLFAKAGVACRTKAVSGHVVDEIIRIAEEEKAGLIVIGSRGLGGFKRLLLGSTSDGVTHHAHCPVLVVR